MNLATTIVEPPTPPAPQHDGSSKVTVPQTAPTNSNVKPRSPKSRTITNGGGLSDPEDYSSAVAAAVANIVASAKAEDYREAEDNYRLDEMTLDVLPPESNVEAKKSSKVKVQKKGKAKVNKSKSKQAGIKRSATVRPTSSRQDSLAKLSVSLHNTLSTTATPKVPVPNLLPKNPNVMDLNLYLNRVQNYINHLGYHRVGEPKIRVLTNLSIKHQIETAKSLIKAGEPIKCLHALVLAIYLTNCSNHIERFPINFKSDFNGKEYKHVVLGLYLYGMFGAIGISRDPGLQDKPAAYPRLFDLILDFQRSYSESGHILREVKIGGVITHELHSIEPIAWKVGTVSMDLTNSEMEAAFERISRQLRSKMGSTCLRNVRPTQMVYPSLSSTNNNSPLSAPTPPRLPLAKKSKTSSSLLTTSKSKKSPKKL